MKPNTKMDYGQNVARSKEIAALARTERSIASSWQQQIVVFSIYAHAHAQAQSTLVKCVRRDYDTFIEQHTRHWLKK